MADTTRFPQVSIIIDDVGYNLHNGLRAVNLPGDVSISVLPDTPYAKRLAKDAHGRQKEVLLHLPMQPAGPGAQEKNTLMSDMGNDEMLHILRHHLNAIPYLKGVNNHMGGLLTTLPRPMRLVMKELRRHGNLFYVDSRTSAKSVADHIAQEEGVPAISRDVFLDHARNFDALTLQLQTLFNKARNNGSAIAIGHPHPETLSFLEYWLPKLPKQGVQLIPISRQVKGRNDI